MRVCLAIALLMAGVASTVQAEVLEFPASAILVAQRSAENGQARFAVGPFADNAVEFATVEGTRQSQVWKIRQPSLSTGQIAASLRRQLLEKGYEIVLDCKDAECGGFDFRYALDLVAEPVMHVDLGNFQFITARRDDPTDFLSLMISRTTTGGLVQLDYLGEAAAEAAPVVVATPKEPEGAEPALAAGDVGAALETLGRLSLEDLSFATGSSDLSEGEYTSLAQLATYLLANPDMTVALVGHTDAEGSIAGNLALSKRRAASVLERLASVYGVPRRQMEADGVGYLAPRASNLTEDGRRKNRRVEVVLTSTR